MTRAPKIDPAGVEQHFSRIGNTATALGNYWMDWRSFGSCRPKTNGRKKSGH